MVMPFASLKMYRCLFLIKSQFYLCIQFHGTDTANGLSLIPILCLGNDLFPSDIFLQCQFLGTFYQNYKCYDYFLNFLQILMLKCMT